MNKALCIGVSAYRSAPGGPADLPGVEGDVAEISQLLSGGNGAKYGSMTVLREEEATRERVLDELGKVLDAAPDDDVFIHMAGHGAVEDGAYYFAPHLGGAPFSPERAVPMSTIRERFEACRARRAVLFLDCCHSGGILARDAGARPADPTVARRTLERAIHLEGSEGKMIYAACAEAQSAPTRTRSVGTATSTCGRRTVAVATRPAR